MPIRFLLAAGMNTSFSKSMAHLDFTVTLTSTSELNTHNRMNDVSLDDNKIRACWAEPLTIAQLVFELQDLRKRTSISSKPIAEACLPLSGHFVLRILRGIYTSSSREHHCSGVPGT